MVEVEVELELVVMKVVDLSSPQSFSPALSQAQSSHRMDVRRDLDCVQEDIAA
jgi:hypothetical protein